MWHTWILAKRAWSLDTRKQRHLSRTKVNTPSLGEQYGEDAMHGDYTFFSLEAVPNGFGAYGPLLTENFFKVLRSGLEWRMAGDHGGLSTENFPFDFSKLVLSAVRSSGFSLRFFSMFSYDAWVENCQSARGCFYGHYKANPGILAVSFNDLLRLTRTRSGVWTTFARPGGGGGGWPPPPENSKTKKDSDKR